MLLHLGLCEEKVSEYRFKRIPDECLMTPVKVIFHIIEHDHHQLGLMSWHIQPVTDFLYSWNDINVEHRYLSLGDHRRFWKG